MAKLKLRPQDNITIEVTVTLKDGSKGTIKTVVPDGTLLKSQETLKDVFKNINNLLK